MARKMIPCEYCSDDFIRFDSDLGKNLTLEVYPGHMIAAIAFFINPYDEQTEQATADIPMNYCPNCGRKLV